MGSVSDFELESGFFQNVIPVYKNLINIISKLKSKKKQKFLVFKIKFLIQPYLSALNYILACFYKLKFEQHAFLALFNIFSNSSG